MSSQIVGDRRGWDAQNNRSNGRYPWPFIAFVDDEAKKEGDTNSSVTKTTPRDEYARTLSKSECVKLRNVLDEWEEPAEELEVVSDVFAENKPTAVLFFLTKAMVSTGHSIVERDTPIQTDSRLHGPFISFLYSVWPSRYKGKLSAVCQRSLRVFAPGKPRIRYLEI
jgi:hypothetical protein